MSVNPQSWAGFDLSRPDQMRQFLVQLLQAFAGLQTPQGLASILNGAGQLTQSALIAATYFSFSTPNPTNVNCLGAYAVHATAFSAVSFTFNLTNLSIGVPVFLWLGNTSAASITITLTAKNPSGVSYEIFGKTTGVTSANLASLGVAANNNIFLWGNSSMNSGTPDLRMGYVL